ncbi:MAG: hypothetical protein EOM05_04330 [Clostridia bacterium]|nr:hypothetical protein [Clostridia bacterium]
MNNKKFLSIVVVMIMCITFTIPAFAAGSASVSVSPSSSSITQGTESVSFHIKVTAAGSDLVGGVTATISPSSGLTVTGVSNSSGWMVVYNSSTSKFSSTGEDSFQSTTFTVTCSVSGSVGAGATLSLSAGGFTVESDSGEILSASGASGSVSVDASETNPAATTKAATTKAATTKAATTSTTAGASTTATTIAKSSNASLSSLSIKLIGGYKLSPKFDPSVTKYTLTVPAGTKSLDISAIAKYFDVAKVDIKGGQNLVPDQDNIVTITVTAEDGTKKTYTITVVFADEAMATAKTSEGVKTWLAVLLCILAIIFGFVIGFMVRKIFFEENDDNNSNSNHDDFNNNSFYESHDDSEITQKITINTFEQSADD